MRRTTAMLIGLGALLATADVGRGEPPGTKLLERRVGTWTTKTTFRKAEWTPVERTVSGEEVIGWRFEGKLLEGNVKTDDGPAHWLATCDENEQVYRFWYFDDRGAVPRGDTLGRWDEKAGLLRWENDTGNGYKSTATWKFVGDDRLDWRMLLKNADGQVMLDLAGTTTRVK